MTLHNVSVYRIHHYMIVRPAVFLQSIALLWLGSRRRRRGEDILWIIASRRLLMRQLRHLLVIVNYGLLWNLKQWITEILNQHNEFY